MNLQWAFKRIIDIYEGAFGEEFKNKEIADKQQERSGVFLKLPYRKFPDWFYVQTLKLPLFNWLGR